MRQAVAEPDSSVLPAVAVVYDPMSVTPLVLAAAADGICRLIWVVDLMDPVLGPLMRLLRRLGEVVDTAGLDDAAVVERLAPLNPAGVVTFAEHKIPLAAVVAGAFSLAFWSEHSAELLSNKLRQREALRDAGIPVPSFWAAPHSLDRAAIEVLSKSIRYPVVVKPQGGTASRRTYAVSSADELVNVLAERPIGDDLIEEFLPGRSEEPEDGADPSDQLSVETVISSGHFTHLALTGRFPLAYPFRATGAFVPSSIDGATRRAVLAATEAAASALGLVHGCVNTDVKLTPDGPRIIEVNGRIGGNVPELLSLAGGPDILALGFRIALGVVHDLAALPPLERVSYYHWAQAPVHARRLLALSGLDEVADLPGVDSVVLNRRNGDPLDWRDGGQGHLYSVFGTVANHENLRDVQAAIERTAIVTFD
jgi:biotin carboxylase